VSEINASTGAVTDTIAVGNSPSAISSDGTNVWVANSGAKSISEIDASNDTVLKTIRLAASPTSISSDGTHVWSTEGVNGIINELDATTGNIVKYSPISNPLVSLVSQFGAISSSQSRVWVIDSTKDSVVEVSPPK
jgi:YVTN family beta-propeller protein